MSVEVKGIFKYYGKQAALEDVSFLIPKGEVVGLLGPNGSGKSTLMKIIASYISQDSGTVEVCGLDTQKQSLEVRAMIGYLPENNPLYTEMYVHEYLNFIAGIQLVRKKRKEKIKQLIELTGLTAEQSKKISQLSKGFRQRVGLAQALMNDPSVLILDEPTTGLDPNQLKEIRSLIRDVGKNTTVILSTHIMQEVEALCDRAIILKGGKIVADKKTTDLKSLLSQNYSVVVEFDEDIQPLDLKQLKGVSDVKFVNNKWILEVSSEIDIRPTVFQYAVDHNTHVLSMNKVEKSLEEVFQELTKK